ncbi:MAG: hypothetical protein EWM73_03282 [Nitrospira sp.]|nr:MAG: hypothetical protein EWM73_03282 [Nitrospira sp.]
MGLLAIRIINQGLPFLADLLNKGVSSLLTRVCEKKQLRGAGARNRERTHFWSGRKLVQDDVEQIRQSREDLLQLFGPRLPIRQLDKTGHVLVDGSSDGQRRGADGVVHRVLNRAGLEPFGHNCGEADDEDDDQRYLDLKAQSVPSVQHSSMVVPHVSLFNRNSRQDGCSGISCLSSWWAIPDVSHLSATVKGINHRIFRGLAAASGTGPFLGIWFAQSPGQGR